jgi:hypothetical protein
MSVGDILYPIDAEDSALEIEEIKGGLRISMWSEDLESSVVIDMPREEVLNMLRAIYDWVGEVDWMS